MKLLSKPWVSQVLSVGFVLGLSTLGLAQTPAPNSQIAGITLAANAVRANNGEVPQDLLALLSKGVKSAGDQVHQGRVEVLAWSADAKRVPQIKAQLREQLKKSGWKYEEVAAENLMMLTAVRTSPTRKGILGYWVPTSEALLLLWTEVLPNTGDTTNETDEQDQTPTETIAADPQSFPAAPAASTVIEVAPNQRVVNAMKNAMPKMPAFPKLAPKPNFVRGYAKDAKGNPLVGATIGVRSSSAGGFTSGARGKTDAKGYYEIEIPWGAAEFYNAAYTDDYADGRAAFGLHPADGDADSFASASGSVENWVLLPYGIADRDEAADQPQYPGNYYGGSFSISYFVADTRFGPSNDLPEGATVEVTLTPQGKLIDGSQGAAFIFHQRVEDGVARGFKVNNVPVGTYRLSARLLNNGGAKGLKLQDNSPSTFGLEPKAATGTATLTFRSSHVKADMVAAQHSDWDTVSIQLKQ